MVCLVIFGLHALYSWHAFRRDSADARATVANVSRVFALHADDALYSVDSLLQELATHISETPGNLKQTGNMLTSHVERAPFLEQILVFNTQGRCIQHSDKNNTHAQHTLPDDLLRQHKASNSQAMVFSTPYKSNHGDWLQPVSIRISDTNDAFSGILLATIKLLHFQRYYEAFGMPPSSAVIFGALDGRILARYPDMMGAVNQDISDLPMFARLLAKPSDVGTFFAPQDNKLRIGAYHHLRKYPLFLATTIETSDILSNWFKDTLTMTAIIVLTTIIFAMSGNYLIHQISVRSRIENELVTTKDELQTLNELLQKMALEDSLTGLANRRHFDTVFNSEFQRAIREETCLAILMIDVDFFKKFNDTYGHQAGDICLQKVASCLHTKRYGDLSARYGGEEFVLLLPNTPREGAIAVAQHIQQALGEMHIPHTGNPSGIVTVSIGICADIPYRDRARAEDWLHRADAALYQAKAEGRNLIRIAD